MTEREQIVAWLREKHAYHLAKSEQSRDAHHWHELRMAANINGLAQAIERGDHMEKPDGE